MLYLWVKAFHLIFVVAWMASLLVYPRYKTHQLKAAAGDQLFEEMKNASIRLRKIIMTPSMILVWVLGLAMVGLNPQIAAGGWFIVKFALVIAMTGLHGFFTATGKKIDAGISTMDGRKLRMLNEVPFILLNAIAILVIVKPF